MVGWWENGEANDISAELQRIRKPDHAHEREGTEIKLQAGQVPCSVVLVATATAAAKSSVRSLGGVRYAESRGKRARKALSSFVRSWTAMELYS